MAPRHSRRNPAAGSRARLMRALPVPDVTDAFLRPLAFDDAAQRVHRRKRGSRRSKINSTTPTGFLVANSTILRFRSTRNSSGFIQIRPTRATALFYLGQAYRALNRYDRGTHELSNCPARFSRPAKLAGPASYGLAEISFNEKDFASALPLFHRAAAKVKAPALALSARYFEARCLENLDRKDEARDVYQQVIAAKNPNPYRDDSRLAVGSIFLAAGAKAMR